MLNAYIITYRHMPVSAAFSGLRAPAVRPRPPTPTTTLHCSTCGRDLDKHSTHPRQVASRYGRQPSSVHGARVWQAGGRRPHLRRICRCPSCRPVKRTQDPTPIAPEQGPDRSHCHSPVWTRGGADKRPSFFQ